MKTNNEKYFWIVGIALIIFLVLLLGSLIGLRITKDGLDKVNNSANLILNEPKKNYEFMEDGAKRVTNYNITEYEKELDGKKFENFIIDAFEDTTTITVEITNITEEKIPERYYMIRLDDLYGELITIYGEIVKEMQPGETVKITSHLGMDCSETANIDIYTVD